MTDGLVVARIIAAGLRHLDASVGEETPERLVRFVELLHRWNSVHNVTGAQTAADIAHRHVVDSLSVVGRIPGTDVLDLGSGAGLPGLVVALCCEQLAVTLLDANRKRTAFCIDATAKLGAANVKVVHGRSEDFAGQAPEAFDCVLTRGFATLAVCWRHARPLLRPGGSLLAMKGRYPTGELEEMVELGENAQAISVAVPGLAEQRHLVSIVRESRD